MLERVRLGTRLAHHVVRNRFCAVAKHSNYRALPLSSKPSCIFVRKNICTSSTGMADAAQESGSPGEEPVKSAKQLKKEAQKKEKMEKFMAKKKMEENKKTAKVDFNLPIDIFTVHIFIVQLEVMIKIVIMNIVNVMLSLPVLMCVCV